MTQGVIFAPGEGHTPVSLFDKYTETLSFIKIYGGKLIQKPKNLTYQNWIKSEIMRSDRRCANIIKLLFSALKLRVSKLTAKSLKLVDNSGFVHKRSKSKIIRFMNFNKEIDHEEFVKENVMLFLPWRDEMKMMTSANELFVNNKKLIYEKRSEFVYDEDFETILNEAKTQMQETTNEEGYTPNNLEVFNDSSHEGDIAIDLTNQKIINETPKKEKDLC
ncbi:Protein of unknown function, partial [Cotesia congregata]